MVPKLLKRFMRRTLMNIWESAKYRLVRADSSHEGIRHIVFVCKGNICRSAFAEYYLKRGVPIDGMTIESCGLDVDQGVNSPPVAIHVAKEFELELESHRSKGVASCDLRKADLIIPMEFRQYVRLTTMLPEKKRNIRLMRDFAPWPDRLFCNIDDPYMSGESDFRRCFMRLQKALEGLKNSIAVDRKK